MRRKSSATTYFALTLVTATRARSPGSGPKQNTTMPPARPTAWPFASRSLNATSSSCPARSGLLGAGCPLRGVSLFVKRLEQRVRFVDQLLDALARRIVGRTARAQDGTDDGKRERRAESGYTDADTDPNQRTRRVSIVVMFAAPVVGGLVGRLHRVTPFQSDSSLLSRTPYDYPGMTAFATVRPRPRRKKVEMISEERPEDRRVRALLLALVASTLVHAFVLPAAFWAWGMKLIITNAPPPQREIVASTTAARIERRPVPRAHAEPAPQPAQPRRPAPPAQRPSRHSTPMVASAPRELAREAPTASPQPPKPARRSESAPRSLQSRIAQQERQF